MKSTEARRGSGLRNTDGNVVSGNDVRRTGTGVLLDTFGEDDGAYCRQNTVTQNTLFRCQAEGIRLDSSRARGMRYSATAAQTMESR
ncbi:right-handed parallel beta-helix repeat-containing protein [Paenibacillus sp. P25]|nr:right-handed parallel beta-helix repeat-containing protein [Paenibacillus sp. P25]